MMREKDMEGYPDYDQFYDGMYQVKHQIKEREDVEAGMTIIPEEELENVKNGKYVNTLFVDWVDRHRDHNMVVYDSDGHSAFVSIFSKRYYVLKESVTKCRVLYGKSKKDSLFVTKEYYATLDEFIGDTKHDGFAKLLGCTARWREKWEN